MNFRKFSKKFSFSYKDSKLWILNTIAVKNETLGELPTRFTILMYSFAFSTGLSLVMFGLSGILRYKEVIPILFAVSNTSLTYYISKPYIKLLSRVLNE